MFVVGGVSYQHPSKDVSNNLSYTISLPDYIHYSSIIDTISYCTVRYSIYGSIHIHDQHPAWGDSLVDHAAIMNYIFVDTHQAKILM